MEEVELGATAVLFLRRPWLLVIDHFVGIVFDEYHPFVRMIRSSFSFILSGKN